MVKPTKVLKTMYGNMMKAILPVSVIRCTQNTDIDRHLPGGLKSERHLAQVVKDYDKLAAEMRKSKDPSVESKINGPFVHNLPKRKPVKRKIFTFRGIQSTHSVTHRIQEKKVYNNIYPDVPTNSGLVSSSHFKFQLIFRV